ncbi:helicase-related protein [Sporosarcina sp. FSL K6-5500]|uniref:DEAD/DEAH box helicase n=1 Tax=Sporosarcina sp. FSL K6-5500 TaxID=2921558 RepID=UPI0030F5DE42
MQFYKTETIYDTSTWGGNGRSGKDIVIPPYAVDELLATLQHQNCVFQQEDFVYGQLQIVDEDLPFSFSLENGKSQSCFYLDGQTPAKERVQLVDDFNEGSETIFLISLKAGGTGLNLTGADTVVLYDLWWNPAIEEQAIGRAHRMGQKNVVQVIKLIAQGTIEEKINELQQSKKELIDQVIQTGETMLSSLSEDDIREILSI